MVAEALTFDSLVTDIQTYAERSDEPFITQIPRLIMLAENRIASEVRGLGYIKFVNGTLSINSSTIDKPVRHRETISLSIVDGSNRVTLTKRYYEYCRSFWPNTSLTDVPRYYSDYDYEHLFIVPTPNAAFQFELSYYERPEPLSTTNQTNWTTQYAPQVLLYATLLEAQPFLKLGDRVAEFKGLYDQAVQSLLKESIRRLTDQSAQRTEG
jgi:hypothetical protein